MDETSRRRWHHYVSMFVDLDRPRAVFCTEGRDAESFGRFKQDFAGQRLRICECPLCVCLEPVGLGLWSVFMDNSSRNRTLVWTNLPMHETADRYETCPHGRSRLKDVRDRVDLTLWCDPDWMSAEDRDRGTTFDFA